MFKKIIADHDTYKPTNKHGVEVSLVGGNIVINEIENTEYPCFMNIDLLNHVHDQGLVICARL